MSEPEATPPAPSAPPNESASPSSPPAEATRASPVGTFVKLGVAALVVAFLVWKGAIDPKRVGEALTPGWIGQAFAVVFACISIITLRWWLLLRLENIQLSFPDALKLTLVGHFWNNVLPGAVTGDFVKMYYIGKKNPDLKAEAYATVMIDRVIGLAALVYLSFASALLNLDFVNAKGHEALRWTFYGNAAAAAGFTVGILALVLGIGRNSSFADRVRESERPVFLSARRGYRTLIRLGAKPHVLAASFGLGILSHALLVIIGMTAGHALGERTLSVESYAFVVPVGLFVNSVPIGLPGGIGAGEAAFDTLFGWAGGAGPDGKSVGANVMVLMRLAQLAWGLVGAVFYVFDRRALLPVSEATGAPPAGPTAPTQTLAAR